MLPFPSMLKDPSNLPQTRTVMCLPGLATNVLSILTDNDCLGFQCIGLLALTLGTLLNMNNMQFLS